LYSGIITDCGSVDPGSIPGLRIFSDNVAEWLTRLTANQFLSGAQVRVLPLSLLLLFGERGAKVACGTSDPLIGVQFPAFSRVGDGQLFVRKNVRPLIFLCFLVLRVRGFESPLSFLAKVTKRSNVRDSREMVSRGFSISSLLLFSLIFAWLAQW
jgi:hypothetical protein